MSTNVCPWVLGLQGRLVDILLTYCDSSKISQPIINKLNPPRTPLSRSVVVDLHSVDPQGECDGRPRSEREVSVSLRLSFRVVRVYLHCGP